MLREFQMYIWRMESLETFGIIRADGLCRRNQSMGKIGHRLNFVNTKHSLEILNTQIDNFMNFFKEIMEM